MRAATRRATTPVDQSKIIDRRYELIGPIGGGGMGTLFKVRDPRIGGRVVAMKFLREGVDDENVRERFKQEAHAAGGLSHENIVRIFDVGEHDGQPFIVMEYVEGETITSRIKAGKVTPILQTLDLVEQLCDGLAHAHSRGIIHRDIKPSNLMVTTEHGRQRLKILDFGIAKVSDSALTGADNILGTMNYMSPEQLRGSSAIDHRSDIFAVGSVFYEMLSHRRAFPGTVQDGVLAKIVDQSPEPLSKLVPGLDPEIERIIGTALQKQPGRRYQDLAAMRRDIRQVRMRLVQERIDSLHEAGRKAFELGAYEGTLATCDEILALNPDDARGLALQRTAREAIARQEADDLVARARELRDAGDLTQAKELVRQADDISPDAGRQLAADIDRDLAHRGAVKRARQQLAEGNADGAIAAANDALRHRPDSKEALDIRQRAQTVRAEQERDASAAVCVARARALFAQGKRDEAIQLLRRFVPPHELVTTAVEQLRVEHERIKTRAELDRLVAEASEALDREELTEARALIRRAQKLNPFEPSVANLSARANALEQQRQRQLTADLDQARTLADADRFAEAIAVLEPLASRHDAAREELAEIRERLAAFELRQVADRILVHAESLRQQGRFDEALAELDALVKTQPQESRATRLRDVIARERERLRERERQLELERQAALARERELEREREAARQLERDREHRAARERETERERGDRTAVERTVVIPPRTAPSAPPDSAKTVAGTPAAKAPERAPSTEIATVVQPAAHDAATAAKAAPPRPQPVADHPTVVAKPVTPGRAKTKPATKPTSPPTPPPVPTPAAEAPPQPALLAPKAPTSVFAPPPPVPPVGALPSLDQPLVAPPMPRTVARPATPPSGTLADILRARPQLAAVAALVVLVLSLVAWRLMRPSEIVPSATAQLVTIDATPWANVRIRATVAGTEVPATTFTTPFAVQLPPGQYTLELDNNGVTGATSQQIQVAPNGVNNFHVVMPGFDADRAAAAFVESQ